MCFHALIIATGLLTSPATGEDSAFIAEGASLPAFELSTPDGRKVASKSLEGQIGILIFFRPGQPKSVSTLRDLQKVESQLEGLSWQKVAICSGQQPREAVSRTIDDAEFEGTVLLDPDRAVYSRFGVVALPSVALFDETSKVIYSRASPGVDFVSQLLSNLNEEAKKGRDPEPGVGEQPRDEDEIAPQLSFARRLVERRRYDRARLVLEKLLVEHASEEAHWLLSEVDLQQGRLKPALERLSKARETLPKSALVEVSEARIRTALGEVAVARKLIATAMLHAPLAWQIHLAMAEIHEQQGEKDLALAEYKKVISILRQQLREGD